MQAVISAFSIVGLFTKILKFAVYFYIALIILIEFHIVFFGIVNLFVDHFNYVLVPLKPNYVGNAYNNFLFVLTSLIIKMSWITSILTVLFILSVLCISFFHSKRKKFPGVIIGTAVNNTILLICFTIICALADNFIKPMSIAVLIVLGLALIFYASYLLFFKGKPKKSKTSIFEKPKKIEKENEDNFVFKTSKGNINLLNPFRGIYIQGGAGSGKSASIFEPIIQQCGEKQFTGILYDFKSPELTNLTFSGYASGLIKVKNIDFKQPQLSDRLNPIHPKYLAKSSIAIEYAQVVINNLIPETIKKGDFWSNNAKMILASVIWFLRNEHPEFCTLPHTISLILHTPADKLVEKISQNYESGGMVASLKESIERGAERTVAGMLATLQNALSTLNSKDIFWILSADEVDLHLNKKESPAFLCLGNDSTLPQTYSPIISLIISVALRQMNQPNQLKSVILLDEAPTIFIPNIEQIPATGRSNKIATVFGVQDYSQLANKYGQDIAQVIISNLGNQFFGRVTNGKTAEMVQNLFGKADKTYISKSEGGGTSGQFVHLGSNTNNGTSENIQERDRVKANDLVNLSQGEFYGIIAEGSPREFLKTQFNRAEIVNTNINTKIPVSDEMMSENYFRIVNDCKNLIE